MALVQSSGSYMFHLAFFITIFFCVDETSDILCFKQADNFVKSSDKNSWVQVNEGNTESFLNNSLKELFWTHFICFVCLFAAKFSYFKNLRSFRFEI